MAFKALAAGIYMVLLIGCCANDTRRTGPVKPVHVKNRLPRTTTHEATATSSSPGQHSLDTTFDDSFTADIALNYEVHHEMSESGTNSRHNASEMRHEMHEEKEGKLLSDGAENDTTKSVSEELGTDGLPDNSEKVILQNAAGMADEKRRGGSSVSALYALYSLISYVASASDEYNPGTKSKKSDIAHISSLHVLYSLVSYVAHYHSLDDVNNETNGDNTTQTSAGVSLFSALHQQWGKESGKESAKGSETYNLWTGYLIVAVSVVAAVALIIVFVTCLIRHCRRASTHTVGHRVVVRGVGSPSI